MNKVALAASTAVALVLAGGTASADPYLKFGAGPTWTPALSITVPYLGEFKQDTGTGFNGNVAVGSDLGFWDMPDWSVELGLVYTHNTFAHVTECDEFGVETESGFKSYVPYCDYQISKLALAFDLMYHIPTGTQFSPYLGAGVEARDVILHNGTEVQTGAAGLNQLIVPAGEFQHWDVSGEAVVGVDWNIDATWDPFIEYRYEIRSSNLVENATAGFPHTEYQSHNLIAGIKLHFGD